MPGNQFLGKSAPICSICWFSNINSLILTVVNISDGDPQWAMHLYNPLLFSSGRTCDLVLANRIWHRWWDVTPLIRLCYIRLHLSRLKRDILLLALVRATWQGPPRGSWKLRPSVYSCKELNSVANHMMSLSWDCSPGGHLDDSVWHPEQRIQLSCVDSWLMETSR